MKVNIDHYLADEHDEPVRFWFKSSADQVAINNVLSRNAPGYRENYELIKQPIDYLNIWKGRWTIKFKIDNQ